MYMKTKKRTVNGELLGNLLGKEVRNEVEVLEDRTDHKLYSKGMGLRTKFGTVFMVCSLIMAGIVFMGLQGLLEFQKWNESYYLAKHPLVETKREDGYKSSSIKVTVNRPLTVERQPDKTVYMAVTTGATEVKTTKVLTLEEKERVVANSGLSKIVRGVWELESNSGKNTNGNAHHNECVKVGMTNEFGYRALDDYCFESFEDSVSRVTEWFEAELRTKSLNQALCFYASGKATSTCNYAISFAKLEQDGKLASN